MTTRWPGLPASATLSLERKSCFCCCSGCRKRCELAGENFAVLAVGGLVLATACVCTNAALPELLCFPDMPLLHPLKGLRSFRWRAFMGAKGVHAAGGGQVFIIISPLSNLQAADK